MGNLGLRPGKRNGDFYRLGRGRGSCNFTRYLIVAGIILAWVSTIAVAQTKDVRTELDAPELAAVRLVLIRPDDERLRYVNCVDVAVSAERAMFDRRVKNNPYHVDSPGTSIRFRTDSESVSARVEYPAKSDFKDDYVGEPFGRTYASRGVCLVNGQPKAYFNRPAEDGGRITVDIPAGRFPGMHVYDVVLPYGDKLYFNGIEIEAGAALEPVGEGDGPLYVAYGDSITHGFYASDATRTYPYLLAREKGWRLKHMGFAGRKANETDGEVLAALQPDILTILLGVNDLLGGVTPADFRRRLVLTIDQVRAKNPRAAIYAITPLSIPGYAGYLEDSNERIEPFREAVRLVVAEKEDERLFLIEGPELVPKEVKYFPDDGVHPGDWGYAMIASRLAERIKE